MNRLWSRVGVRATAVGLLVAGLAGGVYLGQDRQVHHQSAEAQAVVQVDVDDMQLLKQRQSEHAAARAWQRQAEGDAAEKAAAEAKAAAGKAHKLETKVIAQQAADKAAAAKKKTESTTSSTASSSGGPVAYAGDIPSSCSDFSGSRSVGCSLMLAAGFKIDQFSCLDKLWKRESGWNYRASNRSSGAYGIPQALPGSKMAKFGNDWASNPATQIKWGLDYIEGRYDSPCGAWSHSENSGWY